MLVAACLLCAGAASAAIVVVDNTDGAPDIVFTGTWNSSNYTTGQFYGANYQHSNKVQGLTATYTPDGGFNGVDSFTYTVIDGNGGSDEGTVTVTVVYVPPAAVLDTLMWKQVWRGKYWRAMAQVRVKDTFGDPIVGAKVKGHWSGAYARNVSATTGSLGRITTRTSWLRRPGTALFTVDKITKDGTDYSLAGEISDSESFP